MRDEWKRWLGWAIAWGWAALAGGGGLWLLVTRGPWPPTNGWFALASGLAACPLTAWALRRWPRVEFSARARFLTAATFYAAGRLALLFWPH